MYVLVTLPSPPSKMNVVPSGTPKGPAAASTTVSPKDMATCTPPATVDVLGRVFDLDDGEWIGASWTVAVKLGGGCSNGIQIVTIALYITPIKYYSPN